MLAEGLSEGCQLKLIHITDDAAKRGIEIEGFRPQPDAPHYSQRHSWFSVPWVNLASVPTVRSRDWVVVVDFKKPLIELVQYCEPSVPIDQVHHTNFQMPMDMVNGQQPFTFIPYAEYQPAGKGQRACRP
jgi:hypothetical protein